MAIGRARTRAADYGEAEVAFETALRASPFDAQAWAELGYAKLLAGLLARGEAERSLQTARSLTARRPLLSAIWFNEAEVFAKRKDSEGARIRYAIAASFGNGVAAKKIAGQSRCTATWTPDLEPIKFLEGWSSVLYAMQPAVCAEQRTMTTNEREARKEACRGCSGLQEKLSGNYCEGPGPWVVANGYMSCQGFEVSIQPMGKGRFVVDEATYEKIPGGFTRTDEGAEGGSDALDMVPLQVMLDHEENGCPVDVDSEVPLYVPVHCQMGESAPNVRGPTVVKLWNAAGEGLLAVTAWGETPKVTLHGKVARIVGAGCDEKVTVGK